MEHKIEAPRGGWLETAHHLGNRSPAAVACPCCGSASLTVTDMEYGSGHQKGLQRYITCGWCGVFNGVNVRRAGSEPPSPLPAEEAAGAIGSPGSTAQPSNLAPENLTIKTLPMASWTASGLPSTTAKSEGAPASM